MTDLDPVTVNNTDYYAYINDNALSLAYSVNAKVLDYEFNGKTPMENINGLLNSMIGSEEALNFFVPVEIEESTSNLSTKNNSAYTEYRPEVSGSSATLTYSFTAEKDAEYFFYLPSDYPREVDLKVNNKSSGTFYASETTRIISLGFFTEGDSVNIGMTLKADVLYTIPNVNSVYYIDVELAKDALATLAQEQLTISDNWKEHHFTGTYSTEKDSTTVFTTLPYDEGWKIFVDGEEIEYVKALEAVIAFNIDSAGEHIVELKYAPKTFTLGLAVSILSLCLFIFIIILEKPLSAVWSKIEYEIDTKNGRRKKGKTLEVCENQSADIESSEENFE
jgi:uncharacterized membrane protein YfhO